MTVLMSDVNANMEHFKKHKEEQIKQLIGRLLSEDDLSFSKIENINAILNMSDEEFNTRLYNLECVGLDYKLLWNSNEEWLTLSMAIMRTVR